ncbi:MAG: FAD-dependent oxidoreductase [Pseudomonadota bacterium]
MRPRIAVVGSGISGLAAAYRLADCAEVSLFEAGAYFGGHTHTVDVRIDSPSGPIVQGVDTGFLVFNERTYPQLIALLAELQVETVVSDMSFSVQVPDQGLEWSGSDLNTVFAQRRNLARPRFWRMLADIVRFNRLATALVDTPPPGLPTIQDFLDEHRFSQAFREGYFLPMIGSIWSCPTDQMLSFPLATMLRFCHNHGLLQVSQRPRWFTVKGGARHYVDKMIQRLPRARLNCPVRSISRPAEGGVLVKTDEGTQAFDQVVLACHSDQSLALLADPSLAEQQVLGAIRYHPNKAVLHTDTRVLPRRRLAWAAWNYERASERSQERNAVCLHYLINRLQPLPFDTPVVVSLNPVKPIRPETVQGEFDYAHPVFDAAAIAAQQRVPQLQGVRSTWFCGAWTRYGFHEDGLMSGLGVAQALRPLCAMPRRETV